MLTALEAVFRMASVGGIMLRPSNRIFRVHFVESYRITTRNIDRKHVPMHAAWYSPDSEGGASVSACGWSGSESNL